MRGRPYVFYALLCLAIFVIGTVVYPVIMCFIFLKLIDSVTESIGYTKQDKFYKGSPADNALGDDGHGRRMALCKTDPHCNNDIPFRPRL